MTSARSKHAGGRPREFDRNAALDAAMRLFWRHGFDGVSFAQLTEAMGIGAPSVYSAFGNKATLYREALDRYAARRGMLDLSLMDERLSLEKAVRTILEATVHGLLDPAAEPGCMLNMGMLVSHPENEDLVRELKQRRIAFRQMLVRKLGSWLDSKRAARLARLLVTVMQGMTIQARDGATAAELATIVDDVCNGLLEIASK